MTAPGRLLVVALALIAFGSGTSTAVAAECTDVWEGPVGADWMTAEYWSTEAIPTLEDVACIPGSYSVAIEEGAAQAEVLQGEGEVEISGGTLTLSGEEDSNVGDLRLSGGVRNGPAVLHVTASLTGVGGGLEGTGATIVGNESVATISDPELEGKAGLRVANKHLLKNESQFQINGPAAKLAISKARPSKASTRWKCWAKKHRSARRKPT